MKEGGELERRRPHCSSTLDKESIFPNWASLLPELVQGIADSLLSTTGGIDGYMDMMAVCPSWRSAIAKPSALAAIVDIRFRPRHWIVLDLKLDNSDDDAGLCFHAPTGRFRRLHLPVLRGHTVVGATDGLLVLGDNKAPHLTSVLTPQPLYR